MMRNEVIYGNFLDAIREKIPHRAKLTNTLVDMLMIEKEAVYRRLRGDVPFTFAEVVKVSNELDLSLDNLVGSGTSRSRPFQLKLVEYDNPSELDYSMMEHYIGLLQAFKNEEYSEMADCCNILPQSLYMAYETLSRFYLFKWTYQYGSGENVKSFGEVEPSPRLRELAQQHVTEMRNIQTCSYLLDKSTFRYLVNDIKYFQSIHLITPEEVELLKKDILRFLDDLEVLAARGRFEGTNNAVYIFVSNVNFDAGYNYLETPNNKISIVKAFTLNGIASLDERTFERVKAWVQSLKRISTLITLTGEKERVLFFEQQRAEIEAL